MTKNLNSFKLIIGAFILCTIIFSFLAGGLSGYLIKQPPTVISIQEFKDKYPYVSDNIYSENPNDAIISFKKLREELEFYILEDNKKIGIYFEYLPTGTSIGVNDDTELTGASLFKLPFIMHTYKLIEEDKVELDDKITINPSDLDTRWGTLGLKGAGKEYTVSELIYENIVNSDNTAFNAIDNSVNQTFPHELFSELDLPRPSRNNDNLISTDTSPRQYSKILKSLYFSSYINHESSNEILNLMTQIKDGEGLRADIPENIKISHKIGMKISDSNPEKHFLSDCGIVYVPKRPYILCMMVMEDDQTAINYMRTISNMIYSYISTTETAKR